MSQETTTLEIIAPTTDEAIEKGLEQLGITRDMVDIEVLDGGSRGLLGIGGRQARIRLSVKSFESVMAEVESTEEAEESRREEATLYEVNAVDESSLTADDLQDLKTVRTVVSELLKKMHMKAELELKYIEPQDDKDERVLLVNIEGKDLSILIGRRSETLNSIQYISSLIVSKETGHWVPLLVDVQGYRNRRERMLRQLGRKMAEQAIQSGRRQTLEPMPPNERRIIHLELRDHPQVATESLGEEPNRKVSIYLKK